MEVLLFVIIGVTVILTGVFSLIRFITLSAEAASIFHVYGEIPEPIDDWMGAGFAMRNFFVSKHTLKNRLDALLKGFSMSWEDLEKIKTGYHDRYKR